MRFLTLILCALLALPLRAETLRIATWDPELSRDGPGLLLRDIEAGARIEADQILGDLMRRADGAAGKTSLLGIAYAHAKAYEARRIRENSPNLHS